MQYGIVKRGGDAMDTCLLAGEVAAAYMVAGNETKYQEWKKTEDADCAEAHRQFAF
jgi:hypothetical protein